MLTKGEGTFIGAIIAALVGGLCFIPVIGTLIGGFTGWVVGWFFDDTMLGILSQMGIQGFAMWQVGAFLGFVGGFFRSSSIMEKILNM